jgi:hypothetical protein
MALVLPESIKPNALMLSIGGDGGPESDFREKLQDVMERIEKTYIQLNIKL